MEFDNLQEAIKYAQENNKDVQRQGDKWVLKERFTTPVGIKLQDIKVAIEKKDDNKILKNEVEECL